MFRGLVPSAVGGWLSQPGSVAPTPTFVLGDHHDHYVILCNDDDALNTVTGKCGALLPSFVEAVLNGSAYPPLTVAIQANWTQHPGPAGSTQWDGPGVFLRVWTIVEPYNDQTVLAFERNIIGEPLRELPVDALVGLIRDSAPTSLVMKGLVRDAYGQGKRPSVVVLFDAKRMTIGVMCEAAEPLCHGGQQCVVPPVCLRVLAGSIKLMQADLTP